MIIPKKIHQIWLGNNEVPGHLLSFCQSWKNNHRSWDYFLWTDMNLPELKNKRWFDIVPTFAEKSDILRYELLYQIGGLYVDMDIECHRPIDELIQDLSCFAFYEKRDTLSNALLGSVKDNELYKDLIKEIPNSIKKSIRPNETTGPSLLSYCAKERNDLSKLESCLVHGYYWDELDCKSHLRGRFATHHWEGSWSK